MVCWKRWIFSWRIFFERWFKKSGHTNTRAGIFFDTHVDGVLLHLAFGPECESLGHGLEAFLSDVTKLENVVEIVEFAGQKQLPIDAWICSGLAHAPYSIREVAAWLSEIDALGAPGVLVVQTHDLSTCQKNRLAHELMRRGCRLHERCAIERTRK